MDWPEVKARLEQYVHESCLPVSVSDLRVALQRVWELERLEVTDVAGCAARAEAAEARLAKVVEAGKQLFTSIEIIERQAEVLARRPNQDDRPIDTILYECKRTRAALALAAAQTKEEK